MTYIIRFKFVFILCLAATITKVNGQPKYDTIAVANIEVTMGGVVQYFGERFTGQRSTYGFLRGSSLVCDESRYERADCRWNENKNIYKNSLGLIQRTLPYISISYETAKGGVHSIEGGYFRSVKERDYQWYYMELNHAIFNYKYTKPIFLSKPNSKLKKSVTIGGGWLNQTKYSFLDYHRYDDLYGSIDKNVDIKDKSYSTIVQIPITTTLQIKRFRFKGGISLNLIGFAYGKNITHWDEGMNREILEDGMWMGIEYYHIEETKEVTYFSELTYFNGLPLLGNFFFSIGYRIK
ncbi:MAG: hypothetical protein JKY53_04885 [Flavobacteriales bacterium]|nr:hypothetical protein [Flavobacteriales bacterium]